MSGSSNSSSRSGGIGFTGLLTIVFITLKRAAEYEAEAADIERARQRFAARAAA